MDVLEVMSIPELEQFKAQYKDNESIIKIVDGYIIIKNQEVVEAKLVEDFNKVVDKFSGKLPNPPSGIHNLYFGWAEVEVDDTSKASEDVTIVDSIPEVNDDGAIVTEAVSHTEKRYPQMKSWAWIAETNKGFNASKGSTTRTITTSKRAFTLYKREGLNNTPVGNFRKYSEACRHLSLACAGSLGGTDSGERVLTRNGYVYDAYEGVDFTVSEA